MVASFGKPERRSEACAVGAAWAVIPDERRATILASEAAIVNRRRALDDWIAVGKGFYELRAEAMRQSNSNKPRGRRYSPAYALLELSPRNRPPARDRQERPCHDDLAL